MAREQARLVRSWDELQTGMVCVFRGCACGRSHRFMLGSPVTNNKALPGVPQGALRAFIPHPTLHDLPNHLEVVTEKAVQLHALYRVIDGLEAERAAFRTRERR